jgi:DNA-binding response OmpR family regulator
MGDPPLVLIVDEDYNFTRILEAKLRLSGFEVTIAEDLASASAALRSRHFSLVLLDVRLPDGSGLDSLKDLRELSPKTSFVIITAYEEELLRERALASGARDVLYKPFDLELLIYTIHRFLSHEGGISGVATEAVLQDRRRNLRS